MGPMDFALRLPRCGKPLAILAVQEIAHRPSASFVRFDQRLAFVGVHALLGFEVNRVGLAARRAAVGKAGLIWLQLELFRASRAGSNRKSHDVNMIQPR